MNTKSPSKLRRALSGKNVNHRTGSVSPKKITNILAAKLERESPVRKVKKPTDSDANFTFFEQTAVEQKLVAVEYQSLRQDTSSIPLDAENISRQDKKSTRKLQDMSSRLPLADLNVEEHAGTWEFFANSGSPAKSNSASPSRNSRDPQSGSSPLKSVRKLTFDK
ncbi:LANO_0A07184g1_1 [Lachancea nothofagi CBS 11611]|uniref:LANO_0A07184g1_1 n=1 Tax=Lachancea nothofagi CBS 11611 TaxID=1266666 RepID=A0A1G4ISK6_9SACH|nr:LANO_0A07184g1_1 [Lachancea nothofagi CBS 11611]